MKKLFTFIVALFLTAMLWAQSPEKMSYQAVVRNSSDVLITNTQVGMQISILQGSASGTAVYVETQTPTSNANGLVTLEIGSGTVISGDFTTIDWANGLYFIRTETDPTGGTNYTITGKSQLLSVPYALHAKTAETVTCGICGITETDPTFTASQAANIDSTDITNLGNLSGAILLGVISIAYIRQTRLKARNESLSNDLFRQKQGELELLKRERETSKKLVELSTRILETSKELKRKLVNLPEKNLPGVRESLEDLDYILFLNKSVDTTVISKGYDFKKLEFLNDLIESQKQVLSLSLDNYRLKEIAVTLNLSYSYVRNVQSRLRKKLKDEGYETFEDLKIALEA